MGREHIPGTFPPGQGVPKETKKERQARLYPGPADLEEKPRYYVTRQKAEREYFKVWPTSRIPGQQASEAAVCVFAGDPYSLGLASVSDAYLYRSRRVTVPLEMPEPWRTLLIPLSLRATEASVNDLFSEHVPCEKCGFTQSCLECQQRVTDLVIADSKRKGCS